MGNSDSKIEFNPHTVPREKWYTEECVIHYISSDDTLGATKYTCYNGAYMYLLYCHPSYTEIYKKIDAGKAYRISHITTVKGEYVEIRTRYIMDVEDVIAHTVDGTIRDFLFIKDWLGSVVEFSKRNEYLEVILDDHPRRINGNWARFIIEKNRIESLQKGKFYHLKVTLFLDMNRYLIGEITAKNVN